LLFGRSRPLPPFSELMSWSLFPLSFWTELNFFFLPAFGEVPAISQCDCSHPDLPPPCCRMSPLAFLDPSCSARRPFTGAYFCLQEDTTAGPPALELAPPVVFFFFFFCRTTMTRSHCRRRASRSPSSATELCVQEIGRAFFFRDYGRLR